MQQTLTQLIEDFIIHLRAAGRAASTKSCYQQDFERLIEHPGDSKKENFMTCTQFMRENQLGRFTEILYWIFIIIMGCAAISNIIHGKVVHSIAFIIMVTGFVLFFVSKLSVIFKKKLVSFGTCSTSVRMANLYRLGYWLMIFGLLATFAP